MARLAAFDIECVVDVRRSPFSRRHPHFCRAALESDLAPRGIAYVHEPGLGGKREGSGTAVNAGMEDAAFRAYADHMASAAYAAARTRTERLAHERRIALLCAEGDPARCHRSLIADDLGLRGFELVHVLGLEQSRAHVPHPAADLSPAGRLSYPPQGPVQGELFA